MGKKPLATCENASCINPESNLALSPDCKYLLAGTSGARTGILSGTAEEEQEEAAKRAGLPDGAIMVMETKTLSLVKRIGRSWLLALQAFAG